MTPEDERDIRELVVRYADAVSRLDPEAWRATWASDAQWDLGTRTVVGRDAIVELWTSLLPIYTSIIQLPTQGLVRDGDDGVTGRWLVLEILRKRAAETDAIQVACYVDRYVREDGRWVFAQRQLTPHYKGTLATGTFVPLPPLD
jgi:hypothetical protein